MQKYELHRMTYQTTTWQLPNGVIAEKTTEPSVRSEWAQYVLVDGEQRFHVPESLFYLILKIAGVAKESACPPTTPE